MIRRIILPIALGLSLGFIIPLALVTAIHEAAIHFGHSGLKIAVVTISVSALFLIAPFVAGYASSKQATENKRAIGTATVAIAMVIFTLGQFFKPPAFLIGYVALSLILGYIGARRATIAGTL